MSTAEADVVGEAQKTRRRALGVALAGASGLAIATQSRVNGELGGQLNDGLLAAVFSFGGGLVLLLLYLTISPRTREGFSGIRRALRAGTLQRWHLLGGLFGAFLVASQGLSVGALGVAMFTIGVVSGQTVSGLFVDRAGLGPGGAQPLTWNRLLGAVLTIIAVGGSVLGQDGNIGQIWLVLLPLLAGFGIAVQQAVNGRVGVASGNVFTATVVNFAVGTTGLVLAWLVTLPAHGLPTDLPTDWWLYLGGLVGIFFIAMAALVVQWIGVLLLGLSSIAGQLVGAVFLDVLVPAHGDHLQMSTVLSVIGTLVAVGIACLPRKRS